MKTFYRVVSFVALSVAILACENQLEGDLLKTNMVTQGLDHEQAEKARILFAQVLAKSLENEDVRKMLKNEAQKEFNNDTEVLYQMIKDLKISDQQTLAQFMGQQFKSEIEFEQLTDGLPLLTILVPNIGKFNVKEWDINQTIPAVVVRPTYNINEKENDKLESYDSKGNKFFLERKRFPNIPVVVVKDNERVEISNSASGKISSNNSLTTFSRKFNYFFTKDAYNGEKKIKSQQKARQGYIESFDPRIKYAYDNILQYQRDYVYYGIAPELGVNTGSFNSGYSEFLTAMKPIQKEYANNIWDDEVSDFSDGNFEFEFLVTTNDNRATGSFSRGWSIAFDDLYTSTVDGQGRKVATGVKEYTFPGKGLELFSWDMQRYGDKWKMSVLETDPTSSTNSTFNVGGSSTFGFNFSAGVKDGPNFGFNASNTTNSSYGRTVTINGNTDRLFDAEITWSEKILTAVMPEVICYLSGPYGIDLNCYQSGRNIGISSTSTTGVVELSIEPKQK